MKTTLYILTFFIINFTQAQFNFPDLKYIEIESSYLGGTFGYPTSIDFQLINMHCSELENCIEDSDPTTLIGKLTLENNTTIEFHYTEVPSDDSRFIAIYKGKVIFEEAGTVLHLKGKILYIEGITNSYFDKKRKFQFINDEFQEVNQPSYHIGTKGILNSPINIYETDKFINKVASLPKGYRIEIILGMTGGEYNDLEQILIKSEFGLLGWFSFKEISFGEPIIDGFYFHGD